jgi:hypothetical protein
VADAGGRAITDRSRLDDVRVLVVDDARHVLDVLRSMLQRYASWPSRSNRMNPETIWPGARAVRAHYDDASGLNGRRT